VIWLASGAASIVLLGATPAAYSVDTTKAGSTLVFGPLFYVVVIVSAALSVVTILLLRASFRELVPVDSRFSTPSTLALLLIVGVVVVLIGLVPLIAGAPTLSGCVVTSGNTTLPGNCSGLGDLIIGGLVILAGAILVLIGYIGCLIGVWRFGSRFQNSLFKVGAVLLLFPVLNVVAAILILIAAQSERTRVASLGTPAGPRF